MKRIVKIFGIIFICLLAFTVEAANYELKELIPENIETTIVTNNFSYRSFYYKDGKVVFKTIKNISNKDLPISISIGLFDSNRKNIGTINYCDEENIFIQKQEVPFVIEVTSDYLIKDKTIQDISYISVLDDNVTCKKKNSDIYAGETVEKIGQAKNNQLDQPTILFLTIIGVIAIALVSLFLYRLLFTTSFENMDGEDVRIGYRNYNRKLRKQREEELRKNPPKPPEIKKTKTDEVLQQELAAKEEKESELHNFYK